ncbi:hypothetical protein F5X68DRAFT_204288 [Plectosphaerella plurivora]|uniref:Uncharacterized protein n=1 Tax=Plectosphaerella plurivora TaxID=936078 RepID=A0A9P8VE13_9PEZI|nr:hypothetical protein F5X68DRAFT_204288 [Plectosphaerella plurivora]
MCLCDTVAQLARSFDPDVAAALSSDLSRHLSAIRSVLARSKPLSRDVGYQVVPNNQRTAKVLAARPSDPKALARLAFRCRDGAAAFWTASSPDGFDAVVPSELRRRVACVVVDLRSNLGLDAQDWVPPGLADLYRGLKASELRYAGKKYIKMARKLGGVGSILWLPLDVPSSTYERYLNIDDEEAFSHLRSLGPEDQSLNLDDIAQQLISSQLGDIAPPITKYDLLGDYSDLFPRTDRIFMLLAALGGSTIPVDLLQSTRQTQRRWGADGEIKSIAALDFGMPPEMIDALSDDTCLQRVGSSPGLTESTLDDGTTVWSLDSHLVASIMNSISTQTRETLEAIVLRLLCFSCPALYEGKVNWPRDKKKAIWALLDRATDGPKIAASQKCQAIDALLFFAERDFFTIRRAAVARARTILHKGMPFYFHASVALFESIMLRLEGSFDHSTTKARSFLDNNPVSPATTRCDNALRGRLHVSWIENKVHRYDPDAAAVMYDWEGLLPLSTFEIEVTRRLQGTAAKYFHSIGDLVMARASLEQHLSLVTTVPIRENTRLLITTKLAEIFCELREHEKSHELIAAEMAAEGAEARSKTRPFRRLSMASVEVDLGRGRLDEAEATLQKLALAEPPELDDLNDQVLHMRRLMLEARAAHERLRYEEAHRLWGLALTRMSEFSIFAARHPWIAAVAHVSMAHAALALGDAAGAREAWARGADVSRTERCEYVIPTLATVWVPRIVADVLATQGWPFRMMLPGGRPDVTWS